MVSATAVPRPRPAPAPRGRRAWVFACALCALHGWGLWIGMGGREGIASPWPLAKHDHPLYFHSALVTRAFLRQTGTTAGYDPSFMAGYAKSVIFPASSTLPELVVAAFGAGRPVLAYKLYVLIGAAAVPWFVLLAARGLGLGGRATAAAVGLFLVYLWTDFPIQYANYGMVPYLLAVPLAAWALARVVALLEGLGRHPGWGSAVACWAAVLVHFTTALVLVPAVLIAYGARRRPGPRLPASTRRWFWLAIPALVLLGNAFWWWPGPWLAATKGDSGFAFTHSTEGVGARLLKIATAEPPIQAGLWGLGLPGLWLLRRNNRVAGAAVAGFAAAGFGWGYAAGATASLDFLQPGRHTYALYTALALAGGAGIAAFADALRQADRALRRLVGIGLALAALRLFGPPLAGSIAQNLADPLPRLTRAVDPGLAERLRVRPPEPFLGSRPTRTLRWVVENVRRHVRPGERLLYEEGGFGVPGLVEPFGDGRYSGLIPYFAPGVEVLGGPYLHSALTTNFTQFGEGRLFGHRGWGRAEFDRYARLYRPSAIVCWSPQARAFCRENPDRVTVLADDGRMLIGRIAGFAGKAIRGEADVRAEPGRLHVRDVGGELDGPVVLGYHSVPHLRASPPARMEPIYLEDDPAPFLAVWPPPGGTTIELRVPPFGR